MMRKSKPTLVVLFSIFLTSPGFCVEKTSEGSNKPLHVIVGVENQTPFSNDSATQKIMRRNDLQDEGRNLAKQGLYDEALIKYRKATDPALLNHEYEKSGAIGAIRDIYERQGKFELALKEHQWLLEAYEKGPFGKDTTGSYANTKIDKKLELDALIKARDTKSNQPVHDHIKYLRIKYKKYIPPPGGDSGFHSVPINDIIHLYNYLGDAQGGIDFMNYVLSSNKISKFERREYERVKAAFEEDQNTGQKGHLQKVIETSSYIGW